MRTFLVEDKNRGVILVDGTIEAENAIKTVNIDPSLDQSQLKAILDTIRQDLRDGHSGGQLSIAGLEWFEC